MSSTIITISDLIESKEQKEKELKYYQERLEYLQKRVALLQGDINITNEIIRMIEEESVVEIKV